MFLPRPNRSTEVENAILLHFTTPTLLLDSSIPSWESPLKHLDVADVLDITTVFSLNEGDCVIAEKVMRRFRLPLEGSEVELV